MAQKWWSYTSRSGFLYRIGFYHGDETGHFMIYIDENIVTIDFNVTEKKDYHFMVENDMFVLKFDPYNIDEKYILINESQKNRPVDSVKKNSVSREKVISIVIVVVFLLFLILFMWMTLKTK